MTGHSDGARASAGMRAPPPGPVPHGIASRYADINICPLPQQNSRRHRGAELRSETENWFPAHYRPYITGRGAGRGAGDILRSLHRFSAALPAWTARRVPGTASRPLRTGRDAAEPVPRPARRRGHDGVSGLSCGVVGCVVLLSCGAVVWWWLDAVVC